MAKLLMVDDDEDLCLTVAEWLTVNEHHVVEIVHSGEEALYRMKHVGYDVVILDVNLGTDVGGLDVCQQFRSGGGITPIIMLTGRDQIRDKEAGFESGSDDYLTKPFEIRELATRVRALLRRPRQWQASLLSAGTLTLDPARFEVRKNGELLQLSPVDFALLEFFMRNPNEVFSQNVLLDRVWHSDKDATSDALRTAVKRLRKKIDDSDDVNKSMIETVRRVGYRFRPTS